MFYFLTFILAIALSRALFLPSIALSYKLGAIDYPSKRKMHAFPMARGGGFIFFAAFSVIMLISPIEYTFKIALICGGSIMFCVGLFDDTISLSPFQKLSGQAFASAVFVLLNNYESVLENVLCFVWIVFLSNAINLCDGLDGLAGGICATQALCICALSLIFANFNVFLVSVVLLGAIMGFLPRNFPKAKIFMGDCGALFLGFILAALSSKLVFEGGNIILLFSVFLIFRVPTYDTNLSIFRRIIRGKNPFKADKGHFHHQLIKRGFTKECATLALVTVSLFFGLLGILIAAL